MSAKARDDDAVHQSEKGLEAIDAYVIKDPEAFARNLARMVQAAGHAADAHVWPKLAPVLPAMFTPDPAVRSAIAAALVVVAVTQPLSGYVFVIDGVLIGAGDGRWLAVASVVQLLAYLPVVGLVLLVGRSVSGDAWGLSGAAAVTALLWVGFTGFMLVRGLLLRHRVRGDAWAVTGATR